MNPVTGSTNTPWSFKSISHTQVLADTVRITWRIVIPSSGREVITQINAPPVTRDMFRMRPERENVQKADHEYH
jgi:hypothetical protein